MADRSGQPRERILTKGDKRRQLERQAQELLRKRYPDLDILSTLEATNPTQQAALDAWRAWMATIWAELDLRIGEVNAAPDTPPSGWRSVALDRPALRASDPLLKLRTWVRLT